jgi:glycosyltransferase involved in cell wall biosynthesis
MGIGVVQTKPDFRIWIYDPGHFTPYYNAGLCRQYSQLGLACTLLTSPATFEPVAGNRYDVAHLFFQLLEGRIGSLLRHRGGLRRMLKAFSYPMGVWRSYRTLTKQTPGVFHIHFPISPLVDSLLARALRKRGWHVVYTLQEPHPAGAWNHWQYGRLMDSCHAIVMHEEGLAARLRELFPRLANRVKTLTHGADLPAVPTADERTAARQALGVVGGGPLILFFGMIKPYKGLEELLDAMPAVLARLPNARLCIAGEPLMDMTAVRAKIAALPVGTVLEHLEFVPQADVRWYFAAADLVMACYKDIAVSSVLLQGQAYARPVLATRVGALPAQVEQGRCGFLAGQNLAESIIEALSDPQRLEAVGRRGRQRVEKLHSWEHVAAETLRLYPANMA